MSEQSVASTQADEVERGDLVRVRNPKKFDRLCAELDARGIDFVATRGLGGWDLRRVWHVRRAKARGEG